MAGDREVRPQTDDNVIQGLIAFGAPDAVIEAARRNMQNNDDHCEVWPENWQSVLFYLAVRTQWIISAAGGYVGLNYIAIEAAMRIKAIRKPKMKTLFNDLQIIEHTMLPLLNKPKS